MSNTTFPRNDLYRIINEELFDRDARVAQARPAVTEAPAAASQPRNGLSARQVLRSLALGLAMIAGLYVAASTLGVAPQHMLGLFIVMQSLSMLALAPDSGSGAFTAAALANLPVVAAGIYVLATAAGGLALVYALHLVLTVAATANGRALHSPAVVAWLGMAIAGVAAVVLSA